jgi:hypothetical protein
MHNIITTPFSFSFTELPFVCLVTRIRLLKILVFLYFPCSFLLSPFDCTFLYEDAT